MRYIEGTNSVGVVNNVIMSDLEFCIEGIIDLPADLSLGLVFNLINILLVERETSNGGGRFKLLRPENRGARDINMLSWYTANDLGKTYEEWRKEISSTTSLLYGKE